MDFILNIEELETLYSLPHAQQLIYLRGIRPYMDVKTGIVGIKRKISLQSIAEQVYIQPHPGIKEEKFSRAQVRRALSSLERVGLITSHSKNLQLILNCNLATLGYFVQNKVVTNQSQEVITNPSHFSLENTDLYEDNSSKPDIDNSQKADTPLKDNNYNYFLLNQFEKFWDLYPIQKSKQKTWEIFQSVNPTGELSEKIHLALQQQIDFYRQQISQGKWVAAWKYPINWLTQRCWEEELQVNFYQEINNANHQANYKKSSHIDSFWDSCKSGVETDEQDDSNIIEFDRYRRQY